MADDDNGNEIEWYTARKRGIIPMDAFKVSKNVRRLIRQERYNIRYNTRFEETMRHCANRETTWISEDLIQSYLKLHKLGHAHSVEVYDQEGQMQGGLYGVTLGAAFFGESLFHYESETSKIALYYCHKALEEGGFELWDTQFYTEHLAQFGCVEISGQEYMKRLQQAIAKDAVFQQPGD